MTTFTLALVSLLCLAFKATRLIGIVGLTLLALLQPISFAAILAAGAIAFYCYRKLKTKEYQP